MTNFKYEIEFTHDDKQYTFKTETNELNGNQMYWFEPQVTMYSGTLREVKRIIKNIKESQLKGAL